MLDTAVANPTLIAIANQRFMKSARLLPSFSASASVNFPSPATVEYASAVALPRFQQRQYPGDRDISRRTRFAFFCFSGSFDRSVIKPH